MENFFIFYDKNKREFRFKGNFYFGYMGTFIDSQVEIGLEEIDNIWDNKSFNPLTVNLNRDTTEDLIAIEMTKYYQKRQKDIISNIKYINNQFLSYIFIDGIIDSEFEFWKPDSYGNLAKFLIPSKLPNVDEIHMGDSIYTDELSSKFCEVQNYYCVSHSTEQRKKYEPDIHYLIAHYFPMIDLKILLSHIKPDYLSLDGDTLSVQCSSPDCDNGIACSAFAMIDSNNYFFKWDNF